MAAVVLMFIRQEAHHELFEGLKVDGAVLMHAYAGHLQHLRQLFLAHDAAALLHICVDQIDVQVLLWWHGRVCALRSRLLVLLVVMAALGSVLVLFGLLWCERLHLVEEELQVPVR